MSDLTVIIILTAALITAGVLLEIQSRTIKKLKKQINDKKN